MNLISKVPLKNIVVLSLGTGLITLLIGVVSQKFLPPEIPLFYGLPEGHEQLAPALAILLPETLSMVIVFANVLLSSFIENDFLKKTLIVSGFATTVFATVTTIKIILLVGSF